MILGFAILTVSDRCSSGQVLDTSGTLLKQLIGNFHGDGYHFSVSEYKIVPDDKNTIKEVLIKWSNKSEINCIITTGGTGLTLHDVTPEATEEIIEKEVPGISQALISTSLQITPMAMLSRLKCGILNRTLIINFPGSRKACDECFEVIKPILKHAIDQLIGSDEVDALHRKMQDTTKSRVKEIPVSERHRHSPFEMISIYEAFEKIVKEIGHHFDENLDKLIENVPAKSLYKALNFVLANDVYAFVPLPPFNASIKDGYAVIAQDGNGLRKVLCRASTAGMNSIASIESGLCVRISTGAALPPGADAVVPIEDTELVETTEDKGEKVINIKTNPVVGQDIRPIGSDISADDKNPLIRKYAQLTAIDLGLIASIGVKSIQVFSRPKVAVLSTGDEIVSVGESRFSNCVWDSNRTILKSLLISSQFEFIDLGISSDSVDSIFHHIREGLQKTDVIISTGGVSMGERDLMKQVLKEDFSAEIHFGRVNLKPGKPMTFATTTYNGKKKYIFSLPGNPVSAFVTYKIFVEPSLYLLSGKYFQYVNDRLMSPLTFLHKWIKCKVILDIPYKMDTRPEFVRAKISFSSKNDENFIPIAKLTESNQISSRLLNVKNANGLLLLDGSKNGIKFLNNNDIVDAILL